MAHGETYDEFVDKFKPKKTTDDCITPPPVYEAIRAWAVKEYHLEGREIIRPFWNGADYTAAEYPDGCAVIDNPPFSIICKIVQWYEAHGVEYFLFAPALTLFTKSASAVCNYVVMGKDCNIEYENGARVPTSFVTSLGDDFIRTAPDLSHAIRAAMAEVKREKQNLPPAYIYPPNVISSASLRRFADYVDVRFKREEVEMIRALDAQRAKKKAVFGYGFLIRDDKAAEVKAAEVKAAEVKAQREATATRWSLSERERAIIERLNLAQLDA